MDRQGNELFEDLAHFNKIIHIQRGCEANPYVLTKSLNDKFIHSFLKF